MSYPPWIRSDFVHLDDTDNTNALNDFFREQTLNRSSKRNINRIQLYTLLSTLDSLYVTVEEVKAVLRAPPLSKPVGPDGINTGALREVINGIAFPLCFI